MAKKLTLVQLKAIVAAYIDEQKISNPDFAVTANNLVGLVDKVGLIETLDTSFVDKLEIFEGRELAFGKTIEEWQQDLILPEDYDETGAGALAPHYPTYRPVDYSYTLGRKKLAISVKNNDIERAVNNAEEFASVSAMTTKRLYDSVAAYRYECKREMLAKLVAMCDEVETEATAYAAATSFAVGDFIKGGSPTAYGIVVKPITGGESATSTWAKCLSGGFVIILDLIKEIAAPVDTETGEEFIKQVKKDVEIAQDLSEGHSLNGNTLGATEGLVLLVKQGIIPEVEVDVMAGAFQEQRVAFPAQVKVIKDFGSDASGVFAMLVDVRGIKLHNTYKAVRDQMNADGDFLNMFYHTEDTAHISRNTFVRVYRPAE